MGQEHLVVDGSNIATEGRSLPSLQQLLDAVDAVTKEFTFENVTVIVDSTFGHRIDKKEKDAYEDKVNSAQIITPPAGVIGRGDAFILEVADRADAVVLSNDSFQEFHGKYTWLFDEGRLLGGKHVPGVGWIFLARSPVRGPTSRKAVSDAKRKRRGSKKAATKAPAKKSRASTKKAASKPTKKAASADRAPRKSGGKEPEPYNEPLPFIEFVGAHPIDSVVEGEVEQFSSHGAYVMVDGTRCYIALKAISDPPPRSAKEIFTLGETRRFVVKAVDTPRRGIDLGLPDDEELVPASADVEADAGDDDAPGQEQSSTRSRRRGRGRGSGSSSADTADDRGTPVETPEESADATPAGSSGETPGGDKKLSVSQRRKLRAKQAAAEAEPADDTPGGTMAKKAAKKSTAKKRTAKKAATKKAAAKKTTAKKAPAKRKSAAKKAPAKRKTAAKKAPAKRKTAAKKAPAKRKSAAKKAPAKRKTAAKKATPRKRS